MLETLAAYFNCLPEHITIRSVSGGDINQAYQITIQEGATMSSWFIKANHHHYRAMFEAERLALQHLAQFDGVRLPKPYAVLEDATHCYLVMEYLALSGRGKAVEFQFGQQLAELHRVSGVGCTHFGYSQDNFIGTTPQINQPQCADWAEFFVENRLNHLVNQLQSAELNRAYRQALPAIRHWLDRATAYKILINHQFR